MAAAYAWSGSAQSQYANSPLNDYELVRKIGAGGFGEAALYKYKADGCQYVLKKIDITHNSGRMSADTEFSVLSSLRHRYIVEYKDSFVEGDSRYIVMEYCQGGDLASRIRTGNGVEKDLAMVWTWQMCSALEYIHNKGIIHRDMKPQNVFITRTNNIKIGDFAIARDLLPDEIRAYTCIGTFCYMSPEMLRQESYDCRTDVWSLGCIVFEMLTRRGAVTVNNIGQPVQLTRDGLKDKLIDFTNSLLTFDKTSRPSVKQLLQTDVMKAAQTISRQKNDLQIFIKAGARSQTVVVSQDWTVDELLKKIQDERIATGDFTLFTAGGRPIKKKEFRKRGAAQVTLEPTYVEEFELQANSTVNLEQRVHGGSPIYP